MYLSEQELYIDALRPLLAQTECLNVLIGVISQLYDSAAKQTRDAAEQSILKPENRILAAMLLGERNAYKEILNLLTELRRV
jgi:hypothetical protein